MEAYDAAVLSYALAAAAFKGKSVTSSLMGIAPLSTRLLEDSLTPPRETSDNDGDARNYLYQLLHQLEQMVINRTAVQLSHLMEICSTKQTQWDQQICAPLDTLLSELKQICKDNPGSIHNLQMHIEVESSHGVNLNTEVVRKTLMDLLRQFGFTTGANILKQQSVSS